MATETKHEEPMFTMSMFPDELSLYKAKAEHYEAQFEKAARIGYEQDKELKALKGRWHNLKKDPNDLPPHGDFVLLYWDDGDDSDWDKGFYNSEQAEWIAGAMSCVANPPTHWRHLDAPEDAQ